MRFKTFHVPVVQKLRIPDHHQSALAHRNHDHQRPIIINTKHQGFRVLDTGWLKTVREGQTSLTGPVGFSVELRFRGNPQLNEQLLVEEFSMAARVPYEREEGGTSWRHENILYTSFSMSVGETVVVGTSKLNGSEDDPMALVILLTALEPEGAQ